MGRITDWRFSCEAQRLRGPAEAPRFQGQTLPKVDWNALWLVSCNRLLDGGLIIGIRGPVDIEANDQAPLGQRASETRRELEASVDVLEKYTAEDVGIESVDELGPDGEIGGEAGEDRVNVFFELGLGGNGAARSQEPVRATRVVALPTIWSPFR